jgi:hypothetical protein
MSLAAIQNSWLITPQGSPTVNTAQLIFCQTSTTDVLPLGNRSIILVVPRYYGPTFSNLTVVSYTLSLTLTSIVAVVGEIRIVASVSIPGGETLKLVSDITLPLKNDVASTENTLVNTYQIFGSFEVPAGTVGWDIQFGAVNAFEINDAEATITAVGCQIFATPVVLTPS